MIKKFENINNIPNTSGKYTFDIFLKIIDELEISFRSQEYYNNSDVIYLFTSEIINNIDELIDILRYKKSLSYFYNIIKKIKNKRLSFYFSVKNFNLCYGVYDDIDKKEYCIGNFKIQTKDLKKYSNKKCLKPLKNILNNSNIKTLNKIHKIKKDFYNLFKNVNSVIEIVDEYRILNKIPTKSFNENDLDENTLRIHLTQWANKFEWSRNCYYYVNIINDNVHFYIKIKTMKS